MPVAVDQVRRPLVVYLDTQDFSRFGDTIRGISDPEAADTFEQLVQLSESGQVVFPCSMPLISELLQYTAETREICLAKAAAVEKLCGEWALPFPTRLVGMEIAEALISHGRAVATGPIRYLVGDRYWYPNVGNMFSGVREKMRDEVQAAFAGLQPQTYTARRKVKAAKKKFKISKFANQLTFEEAERDLGIPADEARKVLVPLIKGRLSGEEASRRLMNVIAPPEKFVEIFFEKYKGDSTELPLWLRSAGDTLKSSIDESIRQKVAPFRDMPGATELLREIYGTQANEYRLIIPKLGFEDASEFASIAEKDLQDGKHNDLLASLPSSTSLAESFHGYMEQVLGLKGNIAKLERSIAGDLMHLLYLPHVDLWRGDRRFSAVVMERLPSHARRVVPRLRDLMERIASLDPHPNPPRAPSRVAGDPTAVRLG